MSESTKKIALIGGASGGVGSQLAAQLIQNGWIVYGYARDAEKLATVEGLRPLSADATEPESLEKAVAEVLETEGQIDAYAHLIGSVFIRNLTQTQPEQFREVLEVNLLTAFHALRAVVPPMQKRGAGAIALCSSAAARVGLPGHEAIAAAKAGVEGLARSTAASYASRGVRVNVVAPGLIDTPLAAPVISNAKAREISDKMHPLGRIGQPAEIASLLAWLLSPEAGWVTGQIFSQDGGLSSLKERPKA